MPENVGEDRTTELRKLLLKNGLEFQPNIENAYRIDVSLCKWWSSSISHLYHSMIFRTAFGTNLDILLNNINNHLHTVYEWLCNNKLTLNLSKTKYVFFIPRQKKNQNQYPPLKIANICE